MIYDFSKLDNNIMLNKSSDEQKLNLTYKFMNTNFLNKYFTFSNQRIHIFLRKIIYLRINSLYMSTKSNFYKKVRICDEVKNK